jgi:hypothetical protein
LVGSKHWLARWRRASERDGTGRGMDGDGRLSERDGTVAGWENGERSPSYRAGESRVLHIQLSYSGSHTTHLMATTQLHDGAITRDGRTVASERGRLGRSRRASRRDDMKQDRKHTASRSRDRDRGQSERDGAVAPELGRSSEIWRRPRASEKGTVARGMVCEFPGERERDSRSRDGV